MSKVCSPEECVALVGRGYRLIVNGEEIDPPVEFIQPKSVNPASIAWMDKRIAEVGGKVREQVIEALVTGVAPSWDDEVESTCLDCGAPHPHHCPMSEPASEDEP